MKTISSFFEVNFYWFFLIFLLITLLFLIFNFLIHKTLYRKYAELNVRYLKTNQRILELRKKFSRGNEEELALSNDKDIYRLETEKLEDKFLSLLKIHHKNLTSIDRLNCLLFFKSMSDDEISILKKIAKSDVRNIKAELKFKLGLNQKESITKYLNGLLEGDLF